MCNPAATFCVLKRNGRLLEKKATIQITVAPRIVLSQRNFFGDFLYVAAAAGDNIVFCYSSWTDKETIRLWPLSL